MLLLLQSVKKQRRLIDTELIKIHLAPSIVIGMILRRTKDSNHPEINPYLRSKTLCKTQKNSKMLKIVHQEIEFVIATIPELHLSGSPISSTKLTHP